MECTNILKEEKKNRNLITASITFLLSWISEDVLFGTLYSNFISSKVHSRRPRHVGQNV